MSNILIKLGISKIWTVKFETQTLKYKGFTKDVVFIIFYNHYLVKFSELKNQSAEVKISNFNLIFWQFVVESNQGVYGTI